MQAYSKYTPLVILFALSLSFNVKAQNINDALRLGMQGLGSNARALGMGNSYISLSDDASAAFYNPAGFGLLKRLEFSGGFEYVNYNNNTTFFNQQTEYSNSSTRLNRVSFAFPFPTMRGSLVFGLSYHTNKDLTSALKFDGFNNSNNSMIQDLNIDSFIPYDLYLTDSNFVSPILGRLNQSGNILAEGDVNTWTFSGAIEVYKNLFIGGNLNIITGKYESNNEYFEDDTRNIYQGETAVGEPQTGDFVTFYLNRILNWELSGWDAKIGMLYQFNQYGRFGLTVQFPKTFSIKEDFVVNGRSEFGTGQIYRLVSEDYSSAVEYDIITPFEFAAGFSINFKGLIFSAEGTLIDYSQTKFDNLNGFEDPEEYKANVNKSIKDELSSVINYNLGVEYTIPTMGLRLRTGYFVQPSPYRGDELKYDKKYFTAGLGFLTDETIGFDLAYAYGWWEDFGDNYSSNLSRTFQEITVNHFVLTGIYRF